MLEDANVKVILSNLPIDVDGASEQVDGTGGCAMPLAVNIDNTQLGSTIVCYWIYWCEKVCRLQVKLQA